MKRFCLYFVFLLPTLLWGQSEMKAQIYYPNSPQLESIFHDFIEAERMYSYYDESRTYIMKMVVSDDVVSCSFRTGLSRFHNDTIFLDDVYLNITPQEYILFDSTFVQVFVFSESPSPSIPFISRSDLYCHISSYHIESDFEIIDDSIIPAVWEFYYQDGVFTITKKHDAYIY